MREEANAKREDADLKASEAETKTNAAQASRDDFMETIADGVTRQKAGTLIDAAIAGVAVTMVSAKLAAVDETSACVILFANMQLDASSGVCDVRPTLRRKLLDTTFDVDVILSHVSVDEDSSSPRLMLSQRRVSNRPSPRKNHSACCILFPVSTKSR